MSAFLAYLERFLVYNELQRREWREGQNRGAKGRTWAERQELWQQEGWMGRLCRQGGIEQGPRAECG